MKIGIIGAHQVGKTSLAAALSEELTGYVHEPEPYFAMEESGYEFPDIPNAEDYLAQFNYSVQQIARSGHHTIFDRCVIDLLAYIHAVDPSRNIQALFETVETVMPEVDLLVFVPIEEPDLIAVQSDDLPELRNAVNDLLVAWIGDLELDVVTVVGSLQARKAQVLSEIDRLAV
jgi:predicted ATPase